MTRSNKPTANDVRLRWRAARGELHIGFWDYDPPTEPVRPFTPADRWINRVWVGLAASLETQLSKGGRLAVACMVGGQALVGVNDVHSNESFVQRVDRNGRPNPNGDFVGVVLQTGPEGLQAAIGTTQDGRTFDPILTRLGSFVVGERIPEGLQRVPLASVVVAWYST